MPLPPRRIYIDHTKNNSPSKGHHQISTADLPANMQNHFIFMFNTQYIKYHNWILSNNTEFPG